MSCLQTNHEKIVEFSKGKLTVLERLIKYPVVWSEKPKCANRIFYLMGEKPRQLDLENEAWAALITLELYEKFDANEILNFINTNKRENISVSNASILFLLQYYHCHFILENQIPDYEQEPPRYNDKKAEAR